MKVLLVRPKFSTPSPRKYPPFNLITLAPYFNTDVDICDLQTNTMLHHFLQHDTDIVGFTGFSDQLKEINSLAQNVRNKSHAKIIVGGPAVTASPEYALQFLPDVDLLVCGDGEHYATNLSNSIYCPDKICKSPFYNWENHKTPDWTLIDYPKYRNFPGAAVETSRGCPRNCVMCSAHLISGRKWRPRKPEDVVEEIKFVKETYGFNLFYFPDDNATVNPKRWVTLMQLIVDADLNIRLHAPEGLEAHYLTMETLLLMKKAGFQHITIGAESGVQRVLDNVICKSGLTVEQIENVVRDSHEIGLGINCFFIIGTAGETLEEAKETVEFAEKMRGLGAYSCMVRNTIPIPGTPLFNLAQEKGYLTVPAEKLYDSDFIHSGQHLMQTPEWTPRQIELLVQKSQKQDAQHILKHQKKHLLKKGIARLFHNPKTVGSRLKQLVGQAWKK